MARTREFEPDRAMMQITELFWAKGFERTSYDDLVAATGVSRKSLYSTFGDKQTMFEGALSAYRQQIVPKILAPFKDCEDSLEALAQAFEEFGRRAGDGQFSNGCLLVNTVGTTQIDQPAIKRHCNDYLSGMATQLAGKLLAAGVNEARAQELGTYLAGVVQTVALLARADSEPSMITVFAETAAEQIRRG